MNDSPDKASPRHDGRRDRSGAAWGRSTYYLVGAAVGGIILAFFLGWLLGGSRAEEEPSRKPEEIQEPERKIKHWTCSMHPEVVRQDNTSLCPKCAMELVPVYEEDGGGGPASPRQLKLSETAAALASIRTAKAERKFVEVKVRMVGKVTYDETLLYHVTAWVPGRIDRLFVDYTGIAVRKGDHMVELYSPELLQAQEELLEAERSVRRFETGGPPQVLERARRTLHAAEEKLRLWGLLEEQIEAIKERGTPSDHITVFAPHGGIVIQKNGVEGMYVQTGTRIYSIADLNRVWVMVEAYESDLQWLRYGQKVEFTTEAYPGETFEGRISFIEPFLTEQTRTVGVRVVVDNEDGRLKPDMFVRAVVRAQAASGGKVMDPELTGKWICPMHPEVVKDGPGDCTVCGMPLETVESLGYAVDDAAGSPPLVIPASAPLLTGKRAVVYIETESEKGLTFEGREVVLGPRAGDWFIVRAGLREGERVVTHGNFKIDSELQIRGKLSMMNPTGAGGAGSGHAHGNGTSGEETATKPGPRVPESFRESLGMLLSSVDAVRLATSYGDLEAARRAYGLLERSLQLVDAEFLGDEARRLWKELAHSMELAVAEAESAANAGDLRRVLQRLEQDRQRLAEAFGPMEAGDGTGGHQVSAEAQAEAAEPAIPGSFRESFASFFDAYLRLTEELASDDVDGARRDAKALKASLGEVDESELSSSNKAVWVERKAELAKALEQLDPGDIEGLRHGLLPLSQALERTLRQLAPRSGKPVYRIHCPMAFDNRGGSWLAAGKDVRNPYFGSTMLKCGAVKDSLHRFAEDDGSEGDDE